MPPIRWFVDDATMPPRLQYWQKSSHDSAIGVWIDVPFRVAGMGYVIATDPLYASVVSIPQRSV